MSVTPLSDSLPREIQVFGDRRPVGDCALIAGRRPADWGVGFLGLSALLGQSKWAAPAVERLWAGNERDG